MQKVSKAERLLYRGIDTINSISESLHASSTVGLKVGGAIRLDHCAADGQTCSNNAFGQKHASLVTRRKWTNDKVDNLIAFSHLLPE